MRNRGKCVVGAGRLHFLFVDGVEGEFGVVGSVRVCVRYYFNGEYRGDLRVVGAVVDDGVFERVGDGAAGVAVLDDSGSGDVCVDVFCGYNDDEPIRIKWSFVLIVFSECLLQICVVWGRGCPESARMQLAFTLFLGMIDYLDSTQRRHWTFTREQLSLFFSPNDQV